MKRWLLCLLLLACADASAQTAVRGRVDVTLQYGVVAMAGATVSACPNGQACIDYVTGADGMYYFTLAPGDYVIKVNGVERSRVNVPGQQSFDVDPIQVQ